MAANWEDRLLVVIIDPAPRLSLKDSRYFVRSHLMNGRRGKTRLFSQFMRGAGPAHFRSLAPATGGQTDALAHGFQPHPDNARAVR
jgi:hypothetical protein